MMPRAGSAPINARIRVVLPAPLRPIRPENCRSPSDSCASRMISMVPIETCSAETSSMGRSAGVEFAVLRPDQRSCDELAHAFVAERLCRRPVRNHGAVVEGQYAVGEPLHDLHVVLDEQDR